MWMKTTATAQSAATHNEAQSAHPCAGTDNEGYLPKRGMSRQRGWQDLAAVKLLGAV
jgi:hypothetical protein